MPNAMFSLEPFHFSEVEDVYESLKGNHEEEGMNKGKQNHLFETEDWRDIDYLCSEYGLYQENISEKGVLMSKDQQQQQQPFADFGMLAEYNLDILAPLVQLHKETAVSGPILTGISEHIEPKKVKPYPFSLASLELLSNHGNGFKRLNGEKLYDSIKETTCTNGGDRELSTEEVMRVAGARYIQLSIPKDDELSMLSHPYGCALSGLSDEETKDVELAHFLLTSAEKVGNQQFDRASKLLNQCDYLSSMTGDPVQRVVYYFAEALRDKIDQATGRILSKGLLGNERRMIDIEEAMMSPNPALLACFQELPFSQVTQFAGMQAILETVASAKRVHIIDLRIRTGVQWTLVIQALAERYACPIELLKITAVATTLQHRIEETGKRLASFAESVNLPFSFKVVMVSDMKDLKEDLFELEADEAVAVYSQIVLRTMLARPDCLETLMRGIRNLKPCIMVVNEVEGSHNSPSFFNRFIEALFFYSAFFDCLEDCMDRNNENRMTTEALYFGEGIRNIVAAEGENRTTRNVKIGTWRAFFARFGMVESELSESSLYQASLIVKQFACGNSCTLDMNGKCLLVGWKGTPIHSLSAWKFH